MNKYTRIGLTLFACFYFWHATSTYTDWHFIDSVDLIFHEAGHSIFFFLGNFVQVCMGSGFQILLPLAISIYFFIQRQKISGAITLMWVGQNILNVSVYAADAVKMQLDLLGGDNVIHDWNYILGQLNVLKYTDVIAGTLHFLGVIVVLTGSALALHYSSKE